MARWLRFAASHCFNQPCSQLTTSSLTTPESNRCQKLPGPCARKTSTLAKDTTSPAVCRSGELKIHKTSVLDRSMAEVLIPCDHEVATGDTLQEIHGPWRISSVHKDVRHRSDSIKYEVHIQRSEHQTTDRLLKKAFAFKTF